MGGETLPVLFSAGKVTEVEDVTTTVYVVTVVDALTDSVLNEVMLSDVE